MAHLSLALLGALRVELDGAPSSAFESDKVRALLAYLALEADRPHRRAALAGLLWPERPERAAHLSLNQALANLRHAIGDRSATVPVLRITPDTIQFDRASDYDLDVATFSHLLAACEAHPHRHPETCTSCARRLQQAAALYRGSFLDQFFLSDSAAFEEWALLQRERLNRRAIAALVQLAEYHERRGEHAVAEHYTRRQLELDPWREASHRQLMRLLALSGQRSAALAQYVSCRRVLADELGVAPEEETTALYVRIQPGEVLTDAQPVPTTNLAAYAPPTALIGRETELAQLAERLEQRDCRLLTLIGPGGIGKTRLALEVAADLHMSFRDGVCFVPLAALTSAELLVPAIAGALALALSGPIDPKAQLLAYLRAKDMLLVLDNLEQLLAGADVLSDIIQAAPGVVILATSREPLHLRVEWLMDIDGLPVPLKGDAGGVERFSAVQLFVQTARRLQADFALAPANSSSVARICQLVAGTPLAIELAAAWMRSRSCREIAHGLEQSLEQLATTMRDVPAQHRSMRAVFDHSWRLLSAAEQGVLCRLAVFRGGMDVDAAAKVAGATPSLLAALTDKSLLRRNSAGRYDLHELVRQYAGERLGEVGEVEGTRHQHAVCYLERAEMAEHRLSGSDQRLWLDQLEQEHDNMRVAFASVQEARDTNIGMRLVTTLARFWEIRGYWSEGRAAIEAMLSQSKENGDPITVRALCRQAFRLALYQDDYIRATALAEQSLRLSRALDDQPGVADSLRNLGWVAREQNDYARGTALIEESLRLCRAIGDRRGQADTLEQFGEVSIKQGNYARATMLYEESLACYRELDDRNGVALSLAGLARTARRQGDYKRATALHKEQLLVRRGLGDRSEISKALRGLAIVAVEQGDYVQATRLLEQSLALYRELGDKNDIALSLLNLGEVARCEEAYTRAAACYQESLALYRELGNMWGRTVVLHSLGYVALHQGNHGQSAAYFAESLRLAQEGGNQAGVALCLAGFAGIAGAQEESERAVQLFGASEALLTTMRVVLDAADRADYDHNVTAVRAQLDDATFAAAWAAGQALTLEQAIAEALGELTG